MDFTIEKYRELLTSLVSENYDFQTFNEFLVNPKKRIVILRHDVDKLPQNSLRFARIQNEFGIKGSYYFRMVPESWNEEIISEIAGLGHEIGYHYETMDTSARKIKSQKLDHDEDINLIDFAYQEFVENLESIRQLVPVNTICMHGSPMSPYDNKDIWGKYDYRDLKIIGEPYYDIDFNEVFYLTDTGRRWDGQKVSVRDKVDSNFQMSFQETDQIIQFMKNDGLPDRIMFTFHPQRWHDSSFPWIKEFVLQNLKNSIKKYFFVNR